jgi:hypothetical protein
VSDVGYVLAAYAVILGGMAVYTAFLWRRLRAAQGFGYSVSRKVAPEHDRDDEAR